MKSRFIVFILAFAAVSCFANTSMPTKKKALDPHLSLERIFDSQEFTPEHFGPARWMKDGKSYTTVENSPSVKGAKDIILYSAVSGRRKVLVPAQKLLAKGAATPLAIDDYDWSMDGKLLIIFTNSKRVWRRNTKGDFWILNLASGKLTQLGVRFAASTLQFAKISPPGYCAAYVQKNDLYSEDIGSGKIVRLTFDGSQTVINGTGDWVYEEELDIRDGFHWSPDGKFISFWQFDSSGIKDYLLINNTDSLYPHVIPIKYPKVGEMNSACRVGIVSSLGGTVVWLKVAGDARDNYIARMFWSENSKELVIEHLNRLQNTNQVLFGDALTGNIRPVFVDRDNAWVDVVNDFRWLENGAAFTWLSERDNWRHVYIVSRADGRARLVTPGAFDVISVEMIDAKGGWLYYMASPDNPTQRYLFRTRLDGQGKVERLTPYNQPVSHSYQVSPNGA